jgi:transposase-like protein
MAMSSHPHRGFRFPPEVIEHAVWLYHPVSLSLRDVELILAARGILVSYESIREWGLRFVRIFVNMRRCGSSGRKSQRSSRTLLPRHEPEMFSIPRLS